MKCVWCETKYPSKEMILHTCKDCFDCLDFWFKVSPILFYDLALLSPKNRVLFREIGVMMEEFEKVETYPKSQSKT